MNNMKKEFFPRYYLLLLPGSFSTKNTISSVTKSKIDFK